MKRMSAMMALLVLALSVSHAAATPARFETDYDFTLSVAPWGAGAIPMSMVTPVNLLHEVEPIVGMGIAAPPPANGYAALTNPNGAVASYMTVKAQGAGQLVRVNFQARDLYGCGRCAVIAYVSKGMPDSIIGFQKVGMLKAAWGDYTLDVAGDAMDVVVAIGIYNLDMTKKLQRAGVDNVQIQFIGD
jgi:hypothetical protein